MGYWRNIGLALAGLGLTSGASAEGGEPLVTARLADPETHLLSMDGSSLVRTPEERNAAFLSALAASATATRQTVAERCRAIASAVPVAGDARTDWEANCRYRRR
ncbi:hypothetical protein [Sphingomonas flavescens]|uniref:hypothetical protein n=1 Tax=Sphingomonas flavescens TaxID=3132797 RepID=UPI002805E36B|nr:hypothetical protein [Sphingomonas limnosediminicola]